MVVGPGAFAQGLTLPKSPVTINVVDVAGNLALTSRRSRAYRDSQAQSRLAITFSKAPAPELPGKIKAQQDANRVDIDRRADRHRHAVGRRRAEAVDADCCRTTPSDAAEARRHLPARRAEDAGPCRRTRASCVVFCPAGPLLEYNARQGEDAADHGRKSCSPGPRQNPNRFLYARPANSGPGRTFMMGLPYILGDKDPTGPDQRLGQDLGLSQGARRSTSSTTRPAPARP